MARKLGIAPAPGGGVARLRLKALLQRQDFGKPARIVRSAAAKLLQPHPQRLEIPGQRRERFNGRRGEEAMMHESVQLTPRIG